MDIDDLSKTELLDLHNRIINRLKKLESAGEENTRDLKKAFEDLLFSAKRSWISGDHSEGNLWANWKFEQAEQVEKPSCGTFKYWESIKTTEGNKSFIERRVAWAESVLWAANLSPSYTVVNGYIDKNGRYVGSHLREV